MNAGVEAPRDHLRSHPGPRGRGAVGPVRLPPGPAGPQETSRAQSGGRGPAGRMERQKGPLLPARAPRGRRTPARGMSPRHPANFGPPPEPLRITPRPPQPTLGHLTATCRPLPSQPWSTSGPRAGTSVRCRPATLQPPCRARRRGLTVPGAGAARRPGRVAAARGAGGGRGCSPRLPAGGRLRGSGRRRPTARLSHCSGAAAGGGRASPRAGAPNPGAPRPPRPGARPRHTPAPPPRLLFCPSESFQGQVCDLLKSGDLVAESNAAAAGRAPCGPHAAAGRAGSWGRSGGIAHPHFSQRAASGDGRTCVFNVHSRQPVSKCCLSLLGGGRSGFWSLVESK